MELKSNSENLCDSLTLHTVSVMITVSLFRGPEGEDVFVGFSFMLGFFVRKYLWMLRSERARFIGLDIYTNTVAVVVTAYALLLANSLQYIILVPFPISVAGFIIYLYKERLEHHGTTGAEDSSKDRKKPHKPGGAPTHLSTGSKVDDDGLLEKDGKKTGELEMVIIPYFMLLISAIVIPYKDSPVLSHFLLFSCCALGTLALLYSRLAEASPALKPALECIQMAYMVMLFITVHTVAAEWLGEITALVTMPELIAGLVWFYTTLLHGDTYNSRVRSDKDSRVGSSSSSDATQIPSSETKQVSASIFVKGFIFDGSMFIPLGAVLAGLITSTFAYDGELLATWNTMATVACSIAGCLPYLSIWMVSRWPGRIPSSDKAIRLLKFAANMCLTGACLMLFALLAEKTLAYRLFGLDEIIDPSLLKHLPAVYFSTAVALCFFGKHLARALADLGEGLGGLQSSPAARASMETKGRRRRKKKI
ncbi:uncharacterized protein [Miscanthus floridulus]|uniref:uncharacterized protein n=1 Tax=Miscanthus floridulus TaxID=154761 RepID=UPI00345B4253